MASVPINLSSFKPVAGEGRQAAEIANAFTAIESYTGSGLDMNALTQKGATTGQVAVWDGSKWTPGDGRYPMAPTILGPVSQGKDNSTLIANTAWLVPLPGVVTPTTVTRLYYFLASGAGTGNVDSGIYYSDDETTFTRLASKGSMSTNLGPHTIAAATLTPVSGRRWYIAFACSSGTPTFVGITATQTFCYSKATSFPLPATITSPAFGASFCPTLAAQV